ncbi:GDSL-like Lipase/Acylhydrolase OS=Afipia felis OX=1035 GN=NCTC12722_01496 PE=4 SV=1 [Afipia felis]
MCRENTAMNRPITALFALVFALLSLPLTAPGARAQGVAPQPSADGIQISWEVRNRFRLFREERDFELQVEAMAAGRSILAAEDALEIQSDGRGWARNTVGRLCIDPAGHVSNPCLRDNVKEDYLAPADHPVTIRLTGAVPVGAVCAWSFNDNEGPPIQTTLDCSEAINFRVRSGRTTIASVDVSSGGSDTPLHDSTQIAVRDILIAGLGDSIASGEGNPDRPVALSDDGFCFRSYLEGGSTGQYYRPSRKNYRGSRACENNPGSNELFAWQKLGAQWFNAACHRSLYSYQTRAALALAVQYPHIAVTYLPLACSGATINEGLLGSLRARECLITKTSMNCAGTVGAQVAELKDALAAAQRRQPGRQLDLVFLSIGANDINFSGLVADVIVDSATERTLFQRTGMIGSVDDSRSTLARKLPQDFQRLRAALKPLVGGDLSRVVFTSYANPTLANGAPCPGGLAGFDIHPAFNAAPERLARTSQFVESEFLPRLKNIVLCTGGTICNGPRDAMTFVDQHQAAFENHGFCARAATDPAFDQQCFSTNGKSFTTDIVAGASNPMTCGQGASRFRAYLPRARWIRDANDSYFAAMTYPLATRTSSQPTDIHDATWGVLSAVYGGAIHPTAEGHAAMADAAWPAAAAILGLPPVEADVTREPLNPIPLRQ